MQQNDSLANAQWLEGTTWQELPVVTPQVVHAQTFHGIGISRAGRIFMSHSSEEDRLDGLYGQDLFVSYSADFGASWQASDTHFGAEISPGVPQMLFHEDGARTFVDAGDTIMFTTTITPTEWYVAEHSPDPADPLDMYGGASGDKQHFSDVVIRSTNHGRSWQVDDMSQLSPGGAVNPHESNLAVDPWRLPAVSAGSDKTRHQTRTPGLETLRAPGLTTVRSSSPSIFASLSRPMARPSTVRGSRHFDLCVSHCPQPNVNVNQYCFL